MTTSDNKWPRDRTWPKPRTFDQAAALAAMTAATTQNEQAVTNYNPATKQTEKSVETWYTPVLKWSQIATEPNMGRDEGAFYYAILWKPATLTIEQATKRPTDDALAAVRANLANQTTPEWFDATAYWHSVAGMLSHADLARLVGDARIFAHSYKEGGTSIITGHSQRVAFVETFYQVLVPYFTDAEWDIVATDLPPIDATLFTTKSATLAAQTLRLGAASGRHDNAVLGLLDTAKAAGVNVFDALHAMRDPVHLATHAPRLQLHLSTPLALEKWVDRFGNTQMGWIEQSLESVTTKKDRKPLEAVLKAAFAAPATKAAKAKPKPR